MNANRHKQELELLLEKGVIADDAFATIMDLLPAESSVVSSNSTAARNTSSTAPVKAAINTPSETPTPAPPSYAQSIATSPVPTLPIRNSPAPAALPQKPILAHARALYKYVATDARDVSFERNDKISVLEYMNADWWRGRNERTGEEGIFPRNYVNVEQEVAAPTGKVEYNQANPMGGIVNGAQPGYPTPPPVGAGYVPPPGQEGEESGGNKLAEQGKKFGKKLGNAAIFGAGATIGSNIVNSIF